MSVCLFVSEFLSEGVVFDLELPEGITERHKFKVSVPPTQWISNPLKIIRDKNVSIVLVGMTRGWLGFSVLNFVARLHRMGIKVLIYWPVEDAVECVDAERIRSYRRLWLATTVFNQLRKARSIARRLSPLTRSLARRLVDRFRGESRSCVANHKPAPALDHSETIQRCFHDLQALVGNARPVALGWDARSVSADKIKGFGAYLRLDFWSKINSGGSYGHTCYVAKELSKRTESFACFMARKYDLLDQMGVKQIVIPSPCEDFPEIRLLSANAYYYLALKAAFELSRPAYIYERICLGSYVGAKLSQEFSIPYIVEYNGSEITMKRSYDGGGYEHEDIYLLAEEAAFRQATIISVVSEVVRDSLVARGVPANKIIVNPNGVDPEDYKPLDDRSKRVLRSELGFSAQDIVVGFTGTFGGWHGIEVLAGAIPRVSRHNPKVKFLLIGDGNYKYLVDEAVERNSLQNRVKLVGRLPQSEGARMLGACDIFVSPHSGHMLDSRFFGSPTKIFEYMAMGGGIVASDLEQIGQVLRPAIEAGNWDEVDGQQLTDARSILCEPGNLDQFAAAICWLADRADAIQLLGANARKAAVNEFSWASHVDRLLTGCQWQAFFGKASNSPSAIEKPLERLTTGDDYKEEVQNQWNSDPCGSHYVKDSQKHTLEWYCEVENYRYGTYAPWMPEVMEFGKHSGKKVLEIGAGIGTDLSQFAANGAIVTDVDLSAGHLALAQENFQLRGLHGQFVHQDAERLPFDDDSFDVVYSNGVIHHTPNTAQVINEIFRVLKPGGKAIVMVYAEHSLHYWKELVGKLGIYKGMLMQHSVGEIMSRHVEISENNARPLVKVYTARRLRQMFHGFSQVDIVKRQMVASELPTFLKWLPIETAGKLMGWNLIVKAVKPKGEIR